MPRRSASATSANRSREARSSPISRRSPSRVGCSSVCSVSSGCLLRLGSPAVVRHRSGVVKPAARYRTGGQHPGVRQASTVSPGGNDLLASADKASAHGERRDLRPDNVQRSVDGPAPFGRRERHEGSNAVHETDPVHRACAPRRRARVARRGHLEHRTRVSPALTAGHLRHGLGRRRRPGVQRGGPDTRRGSRDLRVRGDRRVRLGDGDRGRLPAVRDRRRRTRGRLGRGRGRRGRASHPRLLPAGPGAGDHRSGLHRLAAHDRRRPGEDGRRGDRRAGRRSAHRRRAPTTASGPP